MKIHDSGRITLTKQEEEFLQDLLFSTGIEIWNADCNQRIIGGTGEIKLCDYYDPLHGKEYQTMAGALTALTKE